VSIEAKYVLIDAVLFLFFGFMAVTSRAYEEKNGRDLEWDTRIEALVAFFAMIALPFLACWWIWRQA